MTAHDIETVARDGHEGSVMREMIEREGEGERVSQNDTKQRMMA